MIQQVKSIPTNGFTLTEVIIVILIIGIIASQVVVKFGDLQSRVNSKAVSDRLTEEIAYTRNYAATKHDTTWVVFDVASNAYGLYVGPTAGTRVLIPDPHENVAGVVDLDDEYTGVTLTSADFSGSSEVSFNWFGEPSSSGTIVINGSTQLNLEAGTGVLYAE